jgi:5-methyltetrahydropteroyltriglutamate--homocysteine methyltransferase
MFVATKDRILPTTVVGSYPRPHWYRESLKGRPFKLALADALFREQYLDAVACITGDEARAGLDIVTDGDARFDLDVGGRSWFFYPIERMGGIEGHTDGSPAWQRRFGVRPGHILWEVQEAYQPPRVTGKLTRGPLEYAALWKTAQRLSPRPVKFGSVCAQSLTSMLIDEHYDDERALIWDLSEIVNAELKEVAAAGCSVIQVEEPGHHFRAQNPATTDADLRFLTEALNREIEGVETEVWVHTCWGNPNQQACYWERPSYARALPFLWELNADVITFECASTGGRDLELLGECPPDKKVAIGVVNHTNTTVEPPEVVASLIRKALRFLPPERLILSSDCGFGREGLSRRIAFYKCAAVVQGANIVRRELGLPEVPIAAADPRLAFGQVPQD